MDHGIVSVCFCTDSSEAINITQYGEPHVHCPCDKCKGRANMANDGVETYFKTSAGISWYSL